MLKKIHILRKINLYSLAKKYGKDVDKLDESQKAEKMQQINYNAADIIYQSCRKVNMQKIVELLGVK